MSQDDSVPVTLCKEVFDDHSEPTDKGGYYVHHHSLVVEKINIICFIYKTIHNLLLSLSHLSIYF